MQHSIDLLKDNETKIKEYINNFKRSIETIQQISNKNNISSLYTIIQYNDILLYLKDYLRYFIDDYCILYNYYIIYFNKFYKTFKLTDTTPPIDILLNNELYDLTIQFITIIFEYVFIIDNIQTYLKSDDSSDSSSDSSNDGSSDSSDDPKEFNTYIKYLKKNYIPKKNDELKTEFPNFDKKMPFNGKIHFWLMYEFNKNILNTNTYFSSIANVDLSTEHSVKILAKPIDKNDIIRCLNNTETTNNFIKTLFKTIKSLKIDTIKNYITIPQYESNCWFISIITGMCYSDMSKNLVLSKILENKNNIYPSIADIDAVVDNKSDINKQFTTFIYYIILNITYKCFTYDDIVDDIVGENYYNDKISKSKLCEIVEFLKFYPDKYLQDMYTYYRRSVETRRSLTNCLTSICKNNIFWFELFKSEFNTNTYINPSHKGATYTGLLLLLKLYNILNINAFVIFNINSKFYILKDLKPHNNDYSVYDIILITDSDDITNIYDIPMKKLQDITDMVNNILSNYDMDYIIQGSNTTYEYKKIGHVISGIHYNGVEFFHTSNTGIDKKCNSINYKMPCSLIQQNWTELMQNHEELFLIKECNYKKINPDTERPSVINFTNPNNFLYNIHHRILKVYIKKQFTTKVNMDDILNPFIQKLVI